MAEKSGSQIKSRKRVADHGEVFTAEREVNAMLDLVKQETERIDSRFLEPACGNGNFLVKILERKLDVVKKKYKRVPMDFEKNSILALSSIYGVDILEDNAIDCRERLFKIWDKAYKSVCKKEVNEDTRKSAQFILEKNIVCGNALSLKKVDSAGNDTDEPIVFSEWAFVMGSKMQRKDYTFDKLLEIASEEPLKRHCDERNDEPIHEDLFSGCHSECSDSHPERSEGSCAPSDEGTFLRQYVSDYRRVWENDAE